MASDPYLEQIVHILELREDDRQASYIATLATITPLVDAGLVTVEQAAQRLEQILATWSAEKRTEGVELRIKLLTTWLRGHIKPETPDAPTRWTPQVIDGGKPQD